VTWHPRNLRWLPSRFRSARDTYSGSDEQIFGANEQIPPRAQTHQQALGPTMWLVPTTQPSGPRPHVYPRGRGLYFGSDEQIFGVNEQILGQDQSDQRASYAA
jgi:hypothetical protein